MATEENVDLTEAHPPHQASIDAFNSVLDSVKHELTKLRHDHDSEHHCTTALIPADLFKSTNQSTSVLSKTSPTMISPPSMLPTLNRCELVPQLTAFTSLAKSRSPP